jgi:anionic cell wall polymer biosynthesis LytR-Cps2A-Psr (LCP) family protein
MSERETRHGALTRAIVGVTASMSLLVGLATAAVTVRWIQARNEGTDPIFNREPGDPGSSASTGKCAEEACNYLLLGSDSRTGLPDEFGTNEDIGGTTRADTIMLVHTDPRLKKAIVLSFPRDLWVKIPGRGFDKLNTAFEGGIKGGGPQLMAKTIAHLTRLSVDHFVFLDLDGFRTIVDTLGGVDMCIPAYNVNTPGWLTGTDANGDPTRVYVGDEGHIADPNSGLNIAPGCQKLDGTQALAYVRSRHLPCDHVPDFSRIGRQQQFLRAVVNQMLRPSVVIRAPALVTPVLENLRRDKGLLPSDLVYLVGQLRGLSTGAVEFRAVPGVAGWEGTRSVVKVDPSASRIFAAIRQGKSLGNAGTQLISTPPSEANTTVAVVDASSQGKASRVEEVLADAGFDVSPGIWGEDRAPADVRGPAIVFRPGADVYAQVVSAYFPGLRVIESEHLRGAHVAIVVTAAYATVPAGGGSGAPPTTCPGAPASLTG